MEKNQNKEIMLETKDKRKESLNSATMKVIYEGEVAAEYPDNSLLHHIDSSHHSNNILDDDDLFLFHGLYECVVCFKEFRSKATLECHLESPRHLWHITKALEDFTFMKELGGRLKKDLAHHYPSEDEFDLEEELDQNSSEEGYCTDENEMPNNGNDSVEKTTKSDSDNSEYDNHNNNRGRTRVRRKSKVRERARRKKMDELKDVYKNLGATRGSNELYQTMGDSYDEFTAQPTRKKYSIDQELERSISVIKKDALMKRGLVLGELAETEKDYVDDLGFIINDFTPLLEEDFVSTSLKQNFSIIFGNIEDIYKFHSRSFLSKIKDCLENPDLLKETFCYHEEDLVILYSQYCKNKPSADEALEIHEAELELVSLKHICDVSQEKGTSQDVDVKNQIRKQYVPTRKLSIKDYLVKPVQRLMKYQLLLNSFKSYSLKAEIDTTDMQDALDVMQRVPKEANDALNVELIQGYQGYLPSTDLIYQETLNVGKSKSKIRPMRVFMFENVVIFTDAIKRNKKLPIYKLVAEGKTSSMGITETVENDALKFAIWFRKYKTTDIFVCQAETAEIKLTWMQVLKDVIAIQAILQNRVSRFHNSFRENLSDRNRRRSRSQSSSLVVIEETIRQRLQGHPRLGEMSQKLRSNIEKYLMDEILELDELKIYKQRQSRSHSLASTLVSKTDMGPVCRPHRSSSSDSNSRSRSRERKAAKETFVDTVSHVSFGVLDGNNNTPNTTICQQHVQKQ